MIGHSVANMLGKFENKYMIASDNVAHVMSNNSAMHAAMVLVSVGYTSIPVLDKENHFVGTISLANVMKQMFEDEVDLNDIQVVDIMDQRGQYLQVPFELEDVLHTLVDANYVSVVNKDKVFLGILTRREFLKAFNYLAHELEREYEVTSKSED